MLELLLAAAASQAVAQGDCPTGLFKSPDGAEQAVLTARPSGDFRYMYADGRRGTPGTVDSPLT